ncbi:MAG: TonB-dependent receptor [Nitrospiraceae bacterium]|nr:TonB-dependent receptor [Nitrospiraceae bacterium]
MKPFIFACLIFIAVSVPAFAESLAANGTEDKTKKETKVDNLEEVVVTGTRIEEPKKNVPASVQVITGEDIKNSTATNAADLISEAGDGNVSIRNFKGGGSSGGIVQLRGFTTNVSGRVINNDVLVLVDGHLASTTDLSQFPSEIIERIEIVKGPASVLYGSSAMGGVINIITKKKGEPGSHGSIFGEGGSWDYWKSGGSLNGSEGSFDYYLTASRSALGAYKAKGYGKIDNTGEDEANISTRFGYKFSDNQYVSFGYRHGKESNIGLPGPRYAPDPDDYANITKDDFDIAYNTETFRANYYFSENKDIAHTSLKAGPGTDVEYFQERKIQGIGSQKTFSFSDYRLIVGGQWDEIDFEGWKSVGTPYEPSNSFYNYAAFSELRREFLDKRLLLNVGLRYDYFENEILPTKNMSITPRRVTFEHPTGRAGLVYKLTDALEVKGNVGEAYRAPSPVEIASDQTDPNTGARRVGNPDLDPEKSITYDVGMDYLKGFFKCEFTAFHTDFTNKITSYFNSSIGPAGATTYKNVNGALIQGVETNLAYNIGIASGLDTSIEPFVNVTYLTSLADKDPADLATTGGTLLNTPKIAASYGLKLMQEKWDAGLIAKYLSDEKVTDPAPPSNGKVVVNKSGFTVFDLKGSYRPIKNLELSASVENLFDRAYAYTLYFPMPSRTYGAAVKWLF